MRISNRVAPNKDCDQHSSQLSLILFSGPSILTTLWGSLFSQTYYDFTLFLPKLDGSWSIKHIMQPNHNLQHDNKVQNTKNIDANITLNYFQHFANIVWGYKTECPRCRTLLEVVMREIEKKIHRILGIQLERQSISLCGPKEHTCKRISSSYREKRINFERCWCNMEKHLCFLRRRLDVLTLE